MSTQAFGAAPPPAAPSPGSAPEPTTKRSPLLLFGAPALAALLVAGGLAYVLLGGDAEDDLATGVPPAAPAPADPTPSPGEGGESTEAPRTVPLSASRNPFDPLVREPASASGGGLAGTAPGGGTTGLTPSGLPSSISAGGRSTTPASRSGSGSGGGTGSSSGSGSGAPSNNGNGKSNGAGNGSPSGNGNGSGSAPGNGNGSGNAPGSGSGSGNGSGAPSGPSGPAPSSLDASATCKAGDELWTAYRGAMTDGATTHTMAGHTIGPVTGSLDALVGTTSVEELRQPLRTWARASASVRTQLVAGTAVRDVEPANPLDDSTGGTPKPGTRPVVDQSSVLLARTAVRERCYQLTDPLVTKDSL